MRADGYRRADDIDPPLDQYAIGQLCAECRTTVLSRYNGYKVCGACRYRLLSDITDDYEGDGLVVGAPARHISRPYLYDRIPKREPIRQEAPDPDWGA